MTRISRIVGLTMAMALVLSGCATPGGGAGGSSSASCSDPMFSPPEKQLCQDNKTFNSTVLGGAATGAAIGGAVTGIACLIAGGNGGQCLKYAAAGAAAGGVLGGVDGYVTAKQQDAARQKVRAIDAVTDDVRNENARLQQSVQTAQTVVSTGRDRLQQLDEQLKSGQINLDQARAERARVERNKQNLDQMITGLEQRRSAYQEASTKTRQSSPEFDAEIQKMNTEIAQLKQQRDTLDHALVISNVG